MKNEAIFSATVLLIFVFCITLEAIKDLNQEPSTFTSIFVFDKFGVFCIFIFMAIPAFLGYMIGKYSNNKEDEK